MNKESFENFEEELTGAIKHWWVFLILGILAIGLGVWLFFTQPMDLLPLPLFLPSHF